jgi:hypothetical protein
MIAVFGLVDWLSRYFIRRGSVEHGMAFLCHRHMLFLVLYVPTVTGPREVCGSPRPTRDSCATVTSFIGKQQISSYRTGKHSTRAFSWDDIQPIPH